MLLTSYLFLVAHQANSDLGGEDVWRRRRGKTCNDAIVFERPLEIKDFLTTEKIPKELICKKSVIQIKTWQRRNFKPFKFKFLKSLNELL